VQDLLVLHEMFTSYNTRYDQIIIFVQYKYRIQCYRENYTVTFCIKNKIQIYMLLCSSQMWI